MERAHAGLFEAVAAESASRLWGGRICHHSAPGLESDRQRDVGHFLVDPQAEEAETPPILCFIRSEYRADRRAIEESIRTGPLAARLPGGAVTADARLRFFWTTPEPDGESAAAAARPRVESAITPHVSYIPDTDERVAPERHSFWRGAGLTLFGNGVVGLAFLSGVALIAFVIPHFVGGTGLDRPVSALPDLLVGLLLVALSLAFLVCDRPWMLLVVAGVLGILSIGHTVIRGWLGLAETAAGALALLAAACSVLLRVRQEGAKTDGGSEASRYNTP